MKKTDLIFFWLVVIVVVTAVMVLAMSKIDEPLRWSLFVGLFIGTVVMCVIGPVRRAREERAEQRIRDEQFQKVILIEAREAQRARAAAETQSRASQAGAQRPNPASRSAADTASPPPTYDPAYMGSGFEISSTMISLFAAPPPSCDTSSLDTSGSSSSYDSSDTSSSACSTDTSSSSGGSDW